jgi:hypothetical protein
MMYSSASALVLPNILRGAVCWCMSLRHVPLHQWQRMWFMRVEHRLSAPEPDFRSTVVMTWRPSQLPCTIPVHCGDTWRQSCKQRRSMIPEGFWRWCITLGITDFWASIFVRYSKKHCRTQSFGNWSCFRPRVRGTSPMTEVSYF